VELSIASRSFQGWTVIDVAGELDLNTAPALREQIEHAVDAGATRVAIGMTEVTFMDSTGLGMLVSSLKRLQERDGQLALVGIDGSPRKVLSITGLDDMMPVYDRAEDLPTG
jgi:anti-sigma B factor antagonist